MVTISPLWSDDVGQTRAYLALEQLASAPYSHFTYGETALAEAAQRHLFNEGACEFAGPHGHVVLGPDGPADVVAAAAWLPGDALRRCRMQGALALARGEFFRRDPDLHRRMGLAAGCFLDPEPGDHCLGRLAVSPDRRRSGHARALVEAWEVAARAEEHTRLVLEVSDEHSAAVGLYGRAGFDALDERRVEDPSTGRRLRYIHMAKPL